MGINIKEQQEVSPINSDLISLFTWGNLSYLNAHILIHVKDNGNDNCHVLNTQYTLEALQRFLL